MIHIAIGDIHGCLNELVRLINENLKDYLNRDDVTWIFLGDYIDRGPNAKGVVDFLLKFAETNNCIFLKGNHEDMMLDNTSDWFRNGGLQTQISYPKKEDYKDHLDRFYIKLWMKYETDRYFFCHAGVDPNYDLKDQSYVDLMWIRQTFLYSEKDYGKIIIHGHTPVSLTEPEIRPNRINIDQGCVFGGRLTAVILEDDKEPVFEQVISWFEYGVGPLNKRSI